MQKRRVLRVLSPLLVVCLVHIVVSADAAEGWTDLRQFLVQSDGSRSLGDTRASFNDTRDQGSKIVYFNRGHGDNATAEVYWWDGVHIVDSLGSSLDSQGRAYGTDPLEPNEDAIKAFQYPVGLYSDERLRTNGRNFGKLAGGYPDWYLLRRGQVHDTFDGSMDGGRSEQEPMVIAAYGPAADGRAIVRPAIGTQVEYNGTQRDIRNPFNAHTGGDSAIWLHEVLVGLEIHTKDLGHYLSHTCVAYDGSVPTLHLEDCKLINTSLTYLPRKSTVRRTISAYRWDPDGHNQGYFTSKFKASTTFDEVIFYKNGYKTDPLTDPDPRRSIFDRNFYQGGGAQMGHVYRNVVSADGGSGGPQMRLGGLCENSLVIEGYWYSSTASNSPVNNWLTAGNQSGRSAIVRNNVQFVFRYPSVRDPDTDSLSDGRAHPGRGYGFAGASFGSVVENNIVSLAMLADDLGEADASTASGYSFSPGRDKYEDSTFYTQKNDTIRGNIAYRTKAGLGLGGDWIDVAGHVAEGNVFVSSKALDVRAESLVGADQLDIRNNRFYVDDSLPDETWIGEGNSVSSYAEAAATEGWSDPDRTLKRYVTEATNLSLLDWQDDPFLDPTAVAVRTAAGEEYDPTGLKTFMAVATNMRYGGTTQVPTSGKPSWNGDYPWDERFTAVAVVNWIREGFGMEPVAPVEPPTSRKARTSPTLTLRSRPNVAGGHGLSFKAAPGSRVSLIIHDLFGRVVRDLGTYAANGDMATVAWDGRNAHGVSVARQTYVVTCTVDRGTRLARRLLCVR